MDSTNFVVVIFVDEDDAPGIVSWNWIIDGATCYYPNVRTEDMKNKLLKTMAKPDITWPKYHIKILKRYDTYTEAYLHLKNTKETKNLNSGGKSTKRKRKFEHGYSSDDSGSHENYPPSSLNNQQILSKNLDGYPKYLMTRKVKSFDCSLSEGSASKADNYTVNVDIDTDVSEHSDAEVNLSKNCQPQEDTNCPPGCVAASKQIAGQLSHLIRVVSEISKQMSEQSNKIDLLLLRSKEPQEDDTEITQIFSSLPAKDDETFNNFNEYLKRTKNKQAIMSVLGGIGGKNIRAITTNMLRKILLDNVAELYSLTGKKMKNSSKKSFIDTETYKLIFQTCRKFYDCLTEDNIKEIIGEWLNQAKVRITRRTERQTKKI